MEATAARTAHGTRINFSNHTSVGRARKCGTYNFEAQKAGFDFAMT
jgi:hypothetical protein